MKTHCCIQFQVSLKNNIWPIILYIFLPFPGGNEIFCKTCYTRQFGVHGLANGVTMTTENSSRVIRHSRRSSYGSDLDTPIINHQIPRPRAHSNDNLLHGEHSAFHNDELPKLFPWRNDYLPEENSLPRNNMNTERDNINDRFSQRSTSPIGFQKLVETNDNYYHRSSSDNSNNDRHQTTFDNNRTSHGTGVSALVEIPVISIPKRSDSTIEQIDIPIIRTRNDDQIRSSTPTVTDNYRRQRDSELMVSRCPPIIFYFLVTLPLKGPALSFAQGSK